MNKEQNVEDLKVSPAIAKPMLAAAEQYYLISYVEKSNETFCSNDIENMLVCDDCNMKNYELYKYFEREVERVCDGRYAVIIAVSKL